MTTWLVIDLGCHILSKAPNHWPEGGRGVFLVAGGIVCGFGVGISVGDWYCGCSTWAQFSTAPQRLWSTVAVTVSAGITGTYYFYSREKSELLKSRVTGAQRDAAEARLKLLQSQLEPHMLFNTLANLRVLIGTDPPRAQHMLDHMIAYLRATLGGSLADTHPLQAEFDRLRDYLELMAIRMGPRLSYTLTLPPELAQHPVPSLLLQPLVENSIQHGLEPKVDGGHISVSARREGDLLVLQVLDTGVGLSTAFETSQGFGLAQVRERLLASYGTASAIELIAARAGGTSATATFPFKT